MSFDKLVEQKIKEAMAEGEFDNLEGSGQPIDLKEYFATPAELRAGYAVLKNARVLPGEAQLLKEANELKERLKDCADEEEQSRLKKIVLEKMLQYNLLIERYRRR